MSSMIHSVKPTVWPVTNIVFTLFCFARFWKVRKGGRTDDMCENNDPYRSWLWVGRVNQFSARTRVRAIFPSPLHYHIFFRSRQTNVPWLWRNRTYFSLVKQSHHIFPKKITVHLSRNLNSPNLTLHSELWGGQTLFLSHGIVY